MKKLVYVFLVLVLSACSHSSNKQDRDVQGLSTGTILNEEGVSQDLASDVISEAEEVSDAIDVVVAQATEEVKTVKSINYQALPVAGPSSPLAVVVLSISLYMFYRYKKA
jgi:hypothetical protein